MKTYILILFSLLGSVALVKAQPCIPNTSSLDFNGISSAVRIHAGTNLDITDQIPGMYFLRLNKAGEGLVRKLIIW